MKGKYTEKGKKVIDGLKRISKPGLRVYASKTVNRQWNVLRWNQLTK